MTVREQTQLFEKLQLSRFAVLSSETAGRKQKEEDDDIRTPFQRDRDRIIHCKAFRRLKHKTQVFLSPEGDHYRTRLTHTLEVSQVARTIARALRLNEDLTEAIALGHDLGHTPFGHAGERALRQVCPAGFDHNLQSVRVAERLEKNFKGLNLTKEVLDGFCHHTWEGTPHTLEGQIVRYADMIAYINHDIDDAIRGGILRDIPSDFKAAMGDSHSKRISFMILDLIENSMDKNKITMSEEAKELTLALKEYMFENVYLNSRAKTEEGKAVELIKWLYVYFSENPEELPDEYMEILMTEGADRAATDYISSMTDHYAVKEFQRLNIPASWSLL